MIIVASYFLVHAIDLHVNWFINFLFLIGFSKLFHRVDDCYAFLVVQAIVPAHLWRRSGPNSCLACKSPTNHQYPIYVIFFELIRWAPDDFEHLGFLHEHFSLKWSWHCGKMNKEKMHLVYDRSFSISWGMFVFHTHR